jgi:hypothetical protein
LNAIADAEERLLNLFGVLDSDRHHGVCTIVRVEHPDGRRFGHHHGDGLLERVGPEGPVVFAAGVLDGLAESLATTAENALTKSG